MTFRVKCSEINKLVINEQHYVHKVFNQKNQIIKIKYLLFKIVN